MSGLYLYTVGLSLFSVINFSFISQPPGSPASHRGIYQSNRRGYRGIDTTEVSGDDLEVSAAGPSDETVASIDENGEPTSTARLNATAGTWFMEFYNALFEIKGDKC